MDFGCVVQRDGRLQVHLEAPKVQPLEQLLDQIHLLVCGGMRKCIDQRTDVLDWEKAVHRAPHDLTRYSARAEAD